MLPFTSIIFFLLLFLGLSVKYHRTAFFFLPLFFITYKIQLQLGVPFTLLELLIDGLFFIWLVQSLWTSERRKALKGFVKNCLKPTSPVALVGTFFLLATVSLLFVPDQMIFQTGIAASPEEVFLTKRIALGIWKGWMIPVWFFVILAQYYILGAKEKRQLMISYTLGAFLVLGISILWAYAGNPAALDGRFGGIFVSANYLTFYLAPAFVFCLIEILHVLKKIWERKALVQELERVPEEMSYREFLTREFHFLVGVALLLGVALFFAKSFGAWLAIAVSFLTYFIATAKKQMRLVGIGLVVVLVVGLFLTQVGTKKFETFTVTDERSSTAVRLQVYDISLQLLQQHWLTGFGMGQYEAQYKVNATKMLGKPPYEWVMLHPHNLYLSIWLSFGVFGLILFLMMIWDAMRAFMKAHDWVFFLPFLYLLIHGLVDTPFWKMDAILIFMLLYCVNVLGQKTSSVKA